jgi:hypothetical protein
MKHKIIPYVLVLAIFFLSCKHKGGEVKSMMIMDSVYTSDKNVTIVGAKDTIRLIESMRNFEDNPNINGADIDAAKRIPSAEIQYVGPGDTIRLQEIEIKKK